jgi:hypothetical protein
MSFFTNKMDWTSRRGKAFIVLIFISIVSSLIGYVVGNQKYGSKLEAKEASEAWEAKAESITITTKPSAEEVKEKTLEAEDAIRRENLACLASRDYKRYQAYGYKKGMPAHWDIVTPCSKGLSKAGYAMLSQGTTIVRETRNCINEKDTSQFVCKEFARKGDEYDWNKYSYKYFRY